MFVVTQNIFLGIRDYTCDQCGKSFIQKGNLDNHLLTHIAARPYSCETCGKAYVFDNILKTKIKDFFLGLKH